MSNSITPIFEPISKNILKLQCKIPTLLFLFYFRKRGSKMSTFFESARTLLFSFIHHTTIQMLWNHTSHDNKRHFYSYRKVVTEKINHNLKMVSKMCHNRLIDGLKNDGDALGNDKSLNQTVVK